MTEFPKTLPSRILQVVKPELEDSEKVQFIGNIVQTSFASRLAPVPDADREC